MFSWMERCDDFAANAVLEIIRYVSISVTNSGTKSYKFCEHCWVICYNDNLVPNVLLGGKTWQFCSQCYGGDYKVWVISVILNSVSSAASSCSMRTWFLMFSWTGRCDAFAANVVLEIIGYVSIFVINKDTWNHKLSPVTVYVRCSCARFALFLCQQSLCYTVIITKLVGLFTLWIDSENWLQYKCSRLSLCYTHGASVGIYVCEWVGLPLLAEKEKPYNSHLFSNDHSIKGFHCINFEVKVDKEQVTLQVRKFLPPCKCLPLLSEYQRTADFEVQKLTGVDWEQFEVITLLLQTHSYLVILAQWLYVLSERMVFSCDIITLF